MNIFRDGWENIENLEIPCNNTREELEKRSFLQAIDLVLDTLSSREKIVIKERFFSDKTYQEIAEKFNICGGRISQIESKALRKLRHPDRRAFFIEENKESLTIIREFHTYEAQKRLKEIKQEEKKQSQIKTKKQWYKKLERDREKKRIKNRLNRERRKIEEDKERLEKEEQQKELQAYYKQEYEKQEAKKQLLKKKGEEIARMLHGNGVPPFIFLGVDRDHTGKLTYYLTALPAYRNILMELPKETYDKWIELLIERAKWMTENYR